MISANIGAVCFGLVIGWVAYRTLRRKDDTAVLSDIATVIGAVGGGTVTVFKSDVLFGLYCIGLAIGFFAYLVINLISPAHRQKTWTWMGGEN